MSWNYNYQDLQHVLGDVDDMCTNPDLLATNEESAWYSAFSFWTMNTGAVGSTCSQAVLEGGSFGWTMKVINGGLECPPAQPEHESSVWERLNDYCIAASALGVDSLLRLDGCEGLGEQFHNCKTGLCSACAVWEGKIGKTDTSSGGGSSTISIPAKAPTPSSSTATTITVQGSSPSSNNGPMMAAEGRPTRTNASWRRHMTPIEWSAVTSFFLFLSHLLW